MPILRAKTGEIEALGHLSPRARKLACPLLDVQHIDEELPQELEERLADIAYKITHAWGTREPLYVDFLRHPPDAMVTSEESAVEFFFRCARQYRLSAIPVTGPEIDRGPGTKYIEAVSHVVARDKRGVAVRLSHDSFSDLHDLENGLNGLLALLGVTASEVDIILDAESLAVRPEHELEMLEDVFADAVTTLQSGNFRSIIMSGSSIPEKIKGGKSTARFDRLEMKIWQQLGQQKGLQNVVFGDYGVTFPRETDPNGPVIPPSRVRLSTPNSQVFFKSPRGTYRTLCEEVLRAGDLEALPASWGRNAVLGYARGYGSEGNPTSWVARDTNAHIETTVAVVAEYLRSLNRLPEEIGISTQPWLQEFLFDR